ncbi:STAS domain-containing protein [Amycolatopsis sp. NBRC 101858]|uniref:STAS domain-containing protein n=1 Tax=Amycolatopsis sp. NBRC 101858 TaxID=3032200 RepID=UPI002555090A|nr:STAS domain-containing protein [Amycolatopsis sp. NBRC 101858]
MTVSTSCGHVILNVRGELDAATVDEFADLADHLLSDRQAAVIIDLSKVSFCSAGALGVLLRLTSDADGHGTPLAILATQPAVLRPIQILGLQPVLPVHTTLADASSWLELLPRLTP